MFSLFSRSSFRASLRPTTACTPSPIFTMTKQPSSDMAAFRTRLAKAQNVLVLTGAGVSAESGVPTFRGAGGFWRRWQAQDLATLSAFKKDPSLVWEFYHYRREVMLTKEPNAGHTAITDLQRRFAAAGRKVTVVTQNIDELHARSGTKDIVELHGSLFRTRCMKCGKEEINKDSPICEALRDKGAPDKEATAARIPEQDLPRCGGTCGGLLRPAVVWFGENLDPKVLSSAEKQVKDCDLCLVVGTSSVVYPAAMFAPDVAADGGTVAEFNMETTPVTQQFQFHFQGPSGKLLPEAFDVEIK